MKYIVETKFNVNDEIWLMNGNVPHKAKIIGIRILGHDYEMRREGEYQTDNFQYLLLGMPASCYGFEAFATKKELVESLMEEGDNDE